MEPNAFQPLLNIDMNWFYLWSLNEKHLKLEISSSRSIKQELFKKLHIRIFLFENLLLLKAAPFAKGYLDCIFDFVFMCMVYAFTPLYISSLDF